MNTPTDTPVDPAMPDPTPDPPPHEAGRQSGPQTGPEGGPQGGPRVDRDDVRNLARLRRSRSDKVIAGVAGGISRHLDIDPVITRVVLVVLFFFGGAGLIVYAACWLLVPLDGEARATVGLDDRNRTVALTLVGVLATLSLLGDSLGGFGFPWPLAVLGFVVVVVMLFRGRNDDPLPPPPAAAPEHGEATRPTYAPPAVPPTPAAIARRPGPVLFWYAVALITIGAGVLASIDLAGVDITASAYPALALVVSGVMLLVGAFWGRPGGLIALGLVSAVLTAGATAAGDFEIDQLERTPTTSSELGDSYDLDIGEIVLDLTELTDPDALDGRRVDLDVNLGRIEVIVPQGLDVTVEADLGAGDSSVFGNVGDSGSNTYTVDGGPSAPALVLDVRVGLGDIDITREGEN